MTLKDVTSRRAVRKAVAEFQKLGKRAFLSKYGFGASRDWMLLLDDQRYDAKAIAGAAHGYQHPELGPLPARQFRGGEATAKQLRSIGFTVCEPEAPARNPTWNRDELILALDLYVSHSPRLPGGTHTAVVELSKMLNRLAALKGTQRADRFRNPAGVAMKLQNFRRFDGDRRRGLKAGGTGEEEVWSTFAGNSALLQETAQAIKAAINADTPLVMPYDDADGAEEGAILMRLHRTRERNRKIVDRRKREALAKHGALRCEACGFHFESVYGERGKAFIECHHNKPISTLGDRGKTKIKDLTLLCSNCHRMIHARQPWLSLNELRDCLRAASYASTNI